RDLGLRALELTDCEWAILEQLHNILKILKDTTLFFSHSTPNLAIVIPVMDLIDETLTTCSMNQQLLPSIRVAAGLAKKTLNCHYELTDSSEVYRIAMVLHPRHKLAYFKRVKWEQQWINTAETLVCNTYKLCLNADNSDPGEDEEILETTRPCDSSIPVSAISFIFSSVV
ncbi:uncharacterized protein F5147DRAFT_572773, partial [Suillus discolor]